MRLFGKQRGSVVLTEARAAGVFRLVERVDGADARWKHQTRAFLLGGMVATDMALCTFPNLRRTGMARTRSSLPSSECSRCT